MRWWTAIGKISGREFQAIWTDSRLRSVVVIAPFIYAALFCFVYIQHTLYDLPIAVVQLDFSAPARTMVRMLEASPKLNVAYRVQSVEEVKDLMLKGDIDAAVVIPSDFSRRLKRGGDAYVPAYVNAASMVSANIGAKAINEVVQTFSAGVEIKTLMKKGESLDAAREKFMPVKLDLRSMFNPSFNYSNFMVPGLLAAILQQVILLGVALSWTGEKENKTLPQLFRISQNPLVLFTGKALPYLVINVLVAEVYLRVLFPLNDIPMEGNWLIAIPFTVLFIATIVSWGMWVSCLCRTRLFATQVLMFVAMPSFVLSGFTWPAEGMPGFIQAIGKMLPLTYFVNSFRNVYLAGAPAPYLIKDFLALLLFTGANLIVSMLVIRWIVKKYQAQTKIAQEVG